MYVDDFLSKKHYSTREESQGCLYGYSGTRNTIPLQIILEYLLINFNGNENKLRKNHHVIGMKFKKFYEPINVLLIYSNVEL